MNRYKREISTLSTAIASLGIGALVLLSCIVASNWLAVQQDTKITAKEKLDASLEASKAIFGGLGTVATIAGGVVLYLNFRVASKTVAIAEKNLNIAKKKLEQDEKKFKEESELTESRLITDRFSKAVEQLSTGKPVECLGGIFLLERLAKDSPNDQWTIIKVLNAYVREKLPRSSGKKPKGTISNYDKQQIQAILNVLGRRQVELNQERLTLDLRKADLRGFNFPPGSNFSNADFRGANLAGVTLKEVIFTSANLRDVDLEGADLGEANLINASLHNANLNRAKLNGAKLGAAKLNGAFLYNADFSDAILKGANLSCAHVQGAVFREADLEDTILSQTIFWDSEYWEHRHWDWETRSAWEDHKAEENERYKEEIAAYLAEHPEANKPEQKWKPDFRQSKNLKKEQLTSAHDCKEGVYDEHLRQALGLPDYDPSEFRDGS